MKLLVTGGLGFIGSNFIKHMITSYPDIEIINFDYRTYAANDIEFPSNKVANFTVDISDWTFLDLMADSLKFKNGDIDCVINFAAETHVDNSIQNADKFIKSNIYGVYNLLKLVRNFNIKKFIQISTDEVYGSVKTKVCKETANFKPSSPYSASKASAEMLCMAYRKTYDLPIIITRACNNYGQFQHEEKFIPTVIRNALQDKKIPLYGNGENIREWLHVIDNCRAIEKVLLKGKIGEIYNVGSGERHQNIQMIEDILQLMGKSYDLVETVTDRAGHDLRYAIDSTKIKRLGWYPKIQLEEGLKETIEYYKGKI